MALINRIARLFKADIHAVIDRLEEPEILLKQAVREMEESIERGVQGQKILLLKRNQLNDRKQSFVESIPEIDEELDLCFRSEQDGLARGLIRRKLEAQRLIIFITRKLESLELSNVCMQEGFTKNNGHLESMRQKLQLLSRETEIHGAESSWMNADIQVQDDEIEIAFLAEQQKRMPS